MSGVEFVLAGLEDRHPPVGNNPPAQQSALSSRDYVPPFPIKTECQFNAGNDVINEANATWQGLRWNIRWSSHEKIYTDLLTARIVVLFFGMRNLTYKIIVKYELKNGFVVRVKTSEATVIIDKAHSLIVFPDLKFVAPARSNDGMLPENSQITISIEHIELVESYTYNQQVWVMGSRWIRYGDELMIKMFLSALQEINPRHLTFFSELKTQILSQKEANAFYEFAGVYFNRWYYGQSKFQEAVLDGLKFGFTSDWDNQDSSDSGFDFFCRTSFPVYQHITDVAPVEHKCILSEYTNGVCDMFRLKLNPDEVHERYQICNLNNVEQHKCQFTFYLEESPQGYLLTAGGCFEVTSRQLAKLKITVFVDGQQCINLRTYRIVHEQQRTIKMIIAIMDDNMMEKMSNSRLGVTVQLHMIGTDATFVHNYMIPEDASTSYVMPGIITGWLKCRDGKTVGVCKEYIANDCEHLRMMFFNTDFPDCGKDEIYVDEDSSIVLDAVSIIYHRSLAIEAGHVRKVLDLGGYWLSTAIFRYLEVALLNSNLFKNSEKLEFAVNYNLDVIKYIMRHPEYAIRYTMPLTDAERNRILVPMANEIDGGPNGRSHNDGAAP